jgi:carboxyl-terminal processing protease
MHIKKYLVPLIFSFVLTLGIFIGNSFHNGQNSNGFDLSSGEVRSQKLKDVVDLLNTKYVDKVNSTKLFNEAIADLLHKLDPHSNYISAEDMKLANEQIQGEFGGVGIRFSLIRDTICVTNVIASSPSEMAGVLAGDRIIQIEGKSVAKKKITNDQVMKYLKGPQGTEVRLVVYRNTKKISKIITRGSIPLQSVISAYMIAPTTGFVKIDQFSITTADEFRLATKRLAAQGMKNLVLDLRNNGGGVLQTAVEITDEFLKKGAIIVKTKGYHTPEQIYRATSQGELEQTKVAVLINSNSASASEIVAGALQDNDRATIYGRRSYGKGLVQEDIVLKDGSDIRLTIARYYTPTGRCIQKAYNGNYEDYLNEEIKRIENGEQFHPDTTLFVDSLKFKTPKGKVVYGGGGIFPDIFIPADTLGSSWYFADLRYSSSFQQFAFDFVQNKRSFWKSLNHFESTFNVDESLLNQFVSYAQKNFKIQSSKVGLTQSKRLIALSLKAEIARQIWTEDGFYRIINREDKEVKEALKLFLK